MWWCTKIDKYEVCVWFVVYLWRMALKILQGHYMSHYLNLLDFKNLWWKFVRPWFKRYQIYLEIVALSKCFSTWSSTTKERLHSIFTDVVELDTWYLKGFFSIELAKHSLKICTSPFRPQRPVGVRWNQPNFLSFYNTWRQFHFFPFKSIGWKDGKGSRLH